MRRDIISLGQLIVVNLLCCPNWMGGGPYPCFKRSQYFPCSEDLLFLGGVYKGDSDATALVNFGHEWQTILIKAGLRVHD